MKTWIVLLNELLKKADYFMSEYLLSRRGKLLKGIDFTQAAGLEIGPLSCPVVHRFEGPIKYLDYLSKEDLIKKYAADGGVAPESIVDIDFVTQGKSIRQAVADGTLFDYVIASHVIEHVPDTIGWLNDIASVLKDKGKLCLVIPDKRFSFDILRQTTAPAIIIEDYLLQRQIPSARAVFDHVSNFTDVNKEAVWSGELTKNSLVRKFPLDGALGLARDIVENSTYHEVHCTVFTPGSFLELLRTLFSLDLIPYQLTEFFATVRNENEFIVQLEKTEKHLDQNLRRELALASLKPYESAKSGDSRFATFIKKIIQRHPH